MKLTQEINFFKLFLVDIVLILLFRYYQPQCEPCLKNDCPPCLAGEQYYLIYFFIAINFIFCIICFCEKLKIFIKQKKIGSFICVFWLLLVFTNLSIKFTGYKSNFFTWNEIVNFLPFSIILSLIGAIYFVFINENVPNWFDDREEKRRKKKSIQKKFDEEISNKYR